MQPTRPSLAEAMHILGGIKNPAGVKFGASKAHRGVLAPPDERGILPIVGPDGISYANTVGAFGVVSAGRNWDRLASASHRWDMAHEEDNQFTYTYFLKSIWF